MEWIFDHRKAFMSEKLRHIALIPDGNRRWARSHGLPVVAGHQKVVYEVLPALVDKCLELGIECFTVWCFSTENWGREQKEVDALLALMGSFYDRFAKKIAQQGVQLTFMGRRDNLPANLQHDISRWLADTATNDRMILNIAFNYGGHDDILRAVNKILERGQYHEIGEQTLRDHLDTSVHDLPDPDLIIRPGGEKRLSGFMSWQSAYSELFFDDKMMPDFGPDDLQRAIDDFYARQRRYGK